uniref:Uncharacterized protein n=1 Tax=Oryza brachyantha TaxID=4533 RepID=J3MJ66_ORYBR
MCMSMRPRRMSAGSSLSTWLVVKTTMRSPPHADQSPSMKLRRPESVTWLDRWSSLYDGRRAARSPPPAAAAEEQLAAPAADVGEVLVDDEAAVAHVEREAEAPPLRLPLPLLLRHRRPPHRHALELVGDVLPVAHADHQPVPLRRALGAQLPRLRRARRAQVRLHLVVGGVPGVHGVVPPVVPRRGGAVGDVDGDVGVDDVEQPPRPPAEEEVEVGQQQPPRRVRRQQRAEEEGQRAEVGQQRGHAGERPAPPPRRRLVAGGYRRRDPHGGRASTS